jgi:hypothetical protein
MKTIRIEGYPDVSFHEDDTIERVRQLIGLSVGRHPDMLFCEIDTELPALYYTSNPKHWSELFFRMSYDGKTIPARVLETYVTRVRLGTGFSPRDVTLEEWESVEGDLAKLRDSELPIRELRILGVEAKNSLVLPVPPRDIPELKSTQYPIPKNQSLFETLHDAKTTTPHVVRVVEYSANASPAVMQIYFPLLRPDTPPTLSDSLANSILASQKHVTDLLALEAPPVQSYSIVRAKWYIPFISTRFSAPRARFEQIFYGMTVNKTTPYIGYFTSPLEKTRHKFFVEDPKTKVPYLDRAIHNAWLNATQPQRRVPTLLLYRSHKDGELSKDSFDRIIVTPSDIVVSVFRKKDSKDTEETIKTRMIEWLSTLDALKPFVNPLDLDETRWELGELSVHGSYATEVDEFFVRRLPCVQTVFERQGDEFGLLRSEHSSTGVSALESQAYRILSQATGVPPTPELLQQSMSLSVVEAQTLFAKVQEMATEGGDFGSSKELPRVSFTEKDVTVRFITGSLERTLAYVSMLRYVLTVKDPPDICEMMGTVPARSIVPQREQAVLPAAVIADAEKLTDEDVDQFGTYGGARKPKKAAEGEEDGPLVVRQTKTGTYNYFNSRLQEYDPDTFDKSIYPGKCEKKVQVVVLTPEARKKIRDTKNSDGQDYTYETAPETEVLDLEDEKGGVAVCPPYWCMRDEIPLREEQLVRGEDGLLHCPVKTCNGKVREKDNQDTQEFTVIKRNIDKPYPDFMTNAKSSINGRAPPCCYKNPRARTVVLPEGKVDSRTYVLNSLDSIDPLRFAKIPESLATKLGITTQYATTIVKGSLATKKKDLFCAGLGRHPAETLPTLLGNKTTPILSPADPEAEKNVIRCSFFRTWTNTEPGEDSLQKRMIKSIDSAYREQRLTLLQELEYVTSFLDCEVIFLDPETYEVECGFWFGAVRESRTIVVIGSAVLCEVSREKKVRQVHEMVYNADINKASFPREMVRALWTAHKTACALDVPVLDDAIAEIGRTDYQYILDPFDRVQAVYVPGELLLPVEPREAVPNGVTKKEGYANVPPAELPTGATMRAFLATANHPGYKLKDELRNVAGEIVELRLASNLRIPIQPEQASPGSKAPVGEVIQTLTTKGHTETELVSGTENASDRQEAEKTTYTSEIYEFLLFSLADDLDQETLSNELDELRTSIVEGNDELGENLSKWYDSRAHEDTSRDPIKFVNKVRTPCGQFSDDPASCNGSSLCAMDRGVCKIRVKPSVSKAKVLDRIEQTLRTNEKQRALVLDNRISPFFSTILYLEMPNEFITVDT